jgi:hypothetical protein
MILSVIWASRLGGFSSNPRYLVLVLLARSQSVSRANCQCRLKGDTLHCIAYKIFLYLSYHCRFYRHDHLWNQRCACVCDRHNLSAIKRGSWNVGISFGMITRCKGVELSWYAPWMHGGECTRVVLLVLNVDNGYMWVVSRTPRPLSSQGIVTQYTFNWGRGVLDGRQGRSKCFGEDKATPSVTKFGPREPCRTTGFVSYRVIG